MLDMYKSLCQLMYVYSSSVTQAMVRTTQTSSIKSTHIIVKSNHFLRLTNDMSLKC